MRITTLQPQSRHPDRYNLSIDGSFALTLNSTQVVDLGLAVGQELSETELVELQSRVEERELFERALRFLAPRPRSRSEVRRRLLAPRPKHRPPNPELVERVLDRLEGLELQDDRQFADFWVENRERFSPRSARALSFELRQRGVTREVIEQASSSDRDEERALAAGRQRLRPLSPTHPPSYAEFHTRLGQFLLRRGFSYSIARRVVRLLWDELAAGSDAADMSVEPLESLESLDE
jgi:regulatory protein